MKLTPLDIHHKEFRRSLRGYNEEEVDKFLDEVADEFERLFKENIDLSEKLEAANDKVRGYAEIERTLHNTMVAAQRSAEDIVSKAQTESDMVLRDAELKAKEIIHTALSQKQKTQTELMRIKQAEEDFRSRFRGMLDEYVRNLREIALPDDVKMVVGKAGDETFGEVEVAPETVERLSANSVESVFPVASPAPQPEPQTDVEPEPEHAPEPEPEQLPTDEPPTSGFVTGLHLGEMSSPELPAEEPTFDEPAPEFEMPNRSHYGEREVDIDIEEID